MRTESEIRTRLDELKEERKNAFSTRLMWGTGDLRYQIQELEWVLGGDEK